MTQPRNRKGRLGPLQKCCFCCCSLGYGGDETTTSAENENSNPLTSIRSSNDVVRLSSTTSRMNGAGSSTGGGSYNGRRQSEIKADQEGGDVRHWEQTQRLEKWHSTQHKNRPLAGDNLNWNTFNLTRVDLCLLLQKVITLIAVAATTTTTKAATKLLIVSRPWLIRPRTKATSTRKSTVAYPANPSIVGFLNISHYTRKLSWFLHCKVVPSAPTTSTSPPVGPVSAGTPFAIVRNRLINNDPLRVIPYLPLTQPGVQPAVTSPPHPRLPYLPNK